MIDKKLTQYLLNNNDYSFILKSFDTADHHGLYWNIDSSGNKNTEICEFLLSNDLIMFIKHWESHALYVITSKGRKICNLITSFAAL